MADKQEFEKQQADILYRLQQAQKFTDPWHKNIKRWRRLYDFDHYDTQPLDNEDRYTDPTYTNTVDLAVGIMQSNEWIWRVVGWKPGSNKESGESNVEKAIAAFIDINSDREQINLKYETNLHFVRDGGAILYGVWDKLIHDNCFIERDVLTPDDEVERAKVFTELPLRIEVIDPLKIQLVPGGHKRWQAVAKTDEISVWEFEQMYQMELTKFSHLTPNQKRTTMHKFKDVWEFVYEIRNPDSETGEFEDEKEAVAKITDDMPRIMVVQNSLLYADTLIKLPKIMDGYDDLPFTLGLFNPASREDTKMWHSIISPLENPVRELEQTTNMRKRLIRLYSNMPLVARTQGGKGVQIDAKIGQVTNLKHGDDIGFPRWEGTAPDVDRHLDFARSRIQQSGFSDVMFGSGANAASGYAISQLGDQNRIRLTSPINHLEDMWTRAARKWAGLCYNFAMDAYLDLYGKSKGEYFTATIKGEDMHGYSINCKIRPEFPSERTRNFALASQAAGRLPDSVIIEDFYGYQQPDDIREMKLQELAENHPVVMEYAVLSKLKKMADAGDEVAQQAYDNLLQKMRMNEGGRPTEPPNPEPAVGMPTQTGEAVPPTQAPDAASILQQMVSASPDMQGNVQQGEMM